MGIKNLNKFLTDTNNAVIVHNNINDYIINRKKNGYKCFNTKNIPHYVGIDVHLYMHKFLYSHNDHLYGFFNQIIKLLLHKIIPIYIFDGIPPYEKKNVLKYRSDKKHKIKNKIDFLYKKMNLIENNESVYDQIMQDEFDSHDAYKNYTKNNYKDEINKLNKQIIQITYKHISELKQLLDILHIPYINATGEADAMCAKLYKLNIIDTCMSEDMDILIFGCKNLIKMNKDNIYEYDMDNILNILNINYDQLINMCLFFGCDYINSIPKKSPVEIYNIVKKYTNIKDIFYELNNNYKTNNEFCDNHLIKYYNAKNIFMKSPDKEIIPKDFAINIIKEINIDVLLKFMNDYSTLKTKHFNNIKIKNNLLYLNKLIKFNYFYNYKNKI